MAENPKISINKSDSVFKIIILILLQIRRSIGKRIECNLQPIPLVQTGNSESTLQIILPHSDREIQRFLIPCKAHLCLNIIGLRIPCRTFSTNFQRDFHAVFRPVIQRTIDENSFDIWNCNILQINSY